MISQNKLIHYSIKFLEAEISELNVLIYDVEDENIKMHLQRLYQEYTADLEELRSQECIIK